MQRAVAVGQPGEQPLHDERVVEHEPYQSYRGVVTETTRRVAAREAAARVKQAQALGDFRALVKRGRRVIGVDLGEATTRGFARVLELIQSA